MGTLWNLESIIYGSIFFSSFAILTLGFLKAERDLSSTVSAETVTKYHLAPYTENWYSNQGSYWSDPSDENHWYNASKDIWEEDKSLFSSWDGYMDLLEPTFETINGGSLVEKDADGNPMLSSEAALSDIIISLKKLFKNRAWDLNVDIDNDGSDATNTYLEKFKTLNAMFVMAFYLRYQLRLKGSPEPIPVKDGGTISNYDDLVKLLSGIMYDVIREAPPLIPEGMLVPKAHIVVRNFYELVPDHMVAIKYSLAGKSSQSLENADTGYLVADENGALKNNLYKTYSSCGRQQR